MKGNLGDLAAKFRALAISEATEALSQEALSLVLEGFEDSKDPYGEPWEPLKYRDGKPLEDTTILRDSFHVKSVERDRFVVAAGVDYAHFHQGGTKDRNAGWDESKETLLIPPRKMIPDEGDLPDRWKERFAEVLNDMITEHFE